MADKPKAQPVIIERTATQRATGTIGRLGTPAAIIMLGGLFLIYFALRGWDAKYGTFNGTFAGAGSIPTGTRARASTVISGVSSGATSGGATVIPASSSANDLSDEIVTIKRYIANLSAVRNPTTLQRQKLVMYQQRLIEYQRRQAGLTSV